MLPEKYSPPTISDLQQAEHWIQIMWRWAVRDAERMSRLEDRVRYLEQPWWRRALRRKRG